MIILLAGNMQGAAANGEEKARSAHKHQGRIRPGRSASLPLQLPGSYQPTTCFAKRSALTYQKAAQRNLWRVDGGGVYHGRSGSRT